MNWKSTNFRKKIKKKIVNIKANKSEIKKYNTQIMELKVGQLLIFNSKLIHRSGDNVSTKVRYSLVGVNHNIDNEVFSPPRFIEVDRKEKFEKYYNSSIKNE